MIIIGLGNQPQVGKNLVARFLISYLRTHGNRSNIKKCSLTYELRLQCNKLYHWSGLCHPDYYETEIGSKEKNVVIPNLGKTPNQIWSEFYNGLLSIHETTLINYILNFYSDLDILVITDLKRPSEIDKIHDKGGFVIRIDRPNVPKSIDIVDLAMTAYENWDYVINNDGDLNKLHQEVVHIISELKI